MTFDLSKGHQRSLGVSGGINKTAALIIAMLSTAAIGGIWSSILRVDPAPLNDSRMVWLWLLFQAFPALVVIVGLFLLPLYFVVLRPAGQTDPTLAIFSVFGAGAVSMVAGLLLVSGPRELVAYDVFKIENRYVVETLRDMNGLETTLKKTEAVALAAGRTAGGDPVFDGARIARNITTEAEQGAIAFERRRRQVRVDLARVLGDSRAGRDRLLVFDQQALAGEAVVERFWSLHTAHGHGLEAYAEALKNNPLVWRTMYGARFRVRSRNDDSLWEAEMALWEVNRDLNDLYPTMKKTPFLNRTVRWPAQPPAPRPNRPLP